MGLSSWGSDGCRYGRGRRGAAVQSQPRSLPPGALNGEHPPSGPKAGLDNPKSTVMGSCLSRKRV